jgi:hypothetical protein
MQKAGQFDLPEEVERLQACRKETDLSILLVLSGQRFGHPDQVARHFGRKLICRERQGSVFYVAEPPVVCGQFFSQVHGCQVHEETTGGSAVSFGRIDQVASHACALARGIDCQQAKISSFTPQFHIDASDEGAGFLDEQEFSFGEKLPHFVWIGAGPHR